MKTNIYSRTNYDYQIPSSFIAQEPASPRDNSRILLVDRKKGVLGDDIFKNTLNLLKKGDVLVLNNTRVIRARLIGKTEKGSKIEILLLKEREKGLWQTLVKPGKRARINTKISFKDGLLKGTIKDKDASGARIIEFEPKEIDDLLAKVGKVPLPPYIKKEVSSESDYQTVYAKNKGAVAAPTAGLHFSQELIAKIKAKGVSIVYLTLHCSLATFRPVKTEDIRDHDIEAEWIELSSDVAKIINQAKQEKRRIVAVGTTAIRTLESVAAVDSQGIQRVREFSGQTNLYIVPGYKFKIIDAVITNFHTPCSTNLILIASFLGLDLTKKSYDFAQSKKMRFFSFGDAMFIY